MPSNEHLRSLTFRLIDSAIRCGSIRVVTPDGREQEFAGSLPGPNARLTVNDWRVLEAVAARGDVGLGEAYMQGWWDSDDLETFIAWTILNLDGLGRYAWGSWFYRVKSVLRDRLWRRNTEAGSRRNILAHYDLGNDFYALWLDPSMSYSSGIYGATNPSLEQAQREKYRRILRRLDDRDRVLEIGCGWGGFIGEATAEGRNITALTISRQQFDYVRRKHATSRGEVRLQDYRKSEGRYPALVSIEMLEAVGEAYWPLYFRTLNERLDRGGVAMVQTITIQERLFQSYRLCNDYIREHVFPGGLLPTLSRINSEAAAAGLSVRDVCSFGTDYARTLRDWLARFDASERDIATLGFDEGFRRGWRFYLAMCAAAFAVGRTDVHQIELRKA